MAFGANFFFTDFNTGPPILLFVDAVDMPAMALFGGRLLIVADFVIVLVFFFCLGFIDAIGSSSDVEPTHLDQVINVFAACCCAFGQGHILRISQYLQQWWFMVE
jgi:hypothetical protein